MGLWFRRIPIFLELKTLRLQAHIAETASSIIFFHHLSISSFLLNLLSGVVSISSDISSFARSRVSGVLVLGHFVSLYAFWMLMDSGSLHRTIPAVEALPSGVKSQGGPNVTKIRSVAYVGSHNLSNLSIASQGLVKCGGSQPFGRQVSCSGRMRGSMLVTFASSESSKCDYRSVATPLEPQSSAGKFLSSVLKNHHHIFHFAAAEQVEVLAADRDDAIARQKHSLGSTESCLHGRIAELKEQECQIAIEEVMYMMIVHKFSEIGVPMVPRLSECMNNGRLDMWASNDRELESVHGLEMLEMIREHLSTIRDWRGKFDAADNRTASRIPRLQLGRVYAASIMYGYFLKSASLRHRLELDFALTDEDLPPMGYGMRTPLHEFRSRGSDNVAVLGCPTDMISSLYQGSGRSRKNEELRGYVMGFDSEALQRCAKLKSREAVNLIEKHSWALFGDDGGEGPMEDDEVISVTFSSLKRLVLEAVAFGSFLWDVERYVDSIYSLKEN